MDIPHLDLWEKYILAFARCQPQKGLDIEIPTGLAKAMSLVKSEVGTESTVVDHATYWDSIYSQGHVSNLILMYAIAGEKYDNVRLDLTLCHLEYLLSHEPAFEDWKDATWVNSIFDSVVSMNVLLPMMTKWLKLEAPEDVMVRYQQILPLYLYLGDFKQLPTKRKECRIIMSGLLSGAFIFGDTSWQGVYYDISRSRVVFKGLVKYADSIFAEKEPEKKFSLLKLFGIHDHKSERVTYKRVGNWLALCAYITLLSKYQRYSLNAEGFKDAKSFVRTEVTRNFLILREKIG